MAILIPAFDDYVFVPMEDEFYPSPWTAGFPRQHHQACRHNPFLSTPMHTMRRLSHGPVQQQHQHPQRMRFDPLAPFHLFRDSGIQITQNKEKLEARVAMDGFDSKDVKVQVDPKSKVMTIEAKKEDKSGENEGMVFSRHFLRSVRLPDECKLDTLKSTMNEAGELKITCEKVEAVQHQEKEKLEAKPAETTPSTSEEQKPLEITVQRDEEKTKEEPDTKNDDSEDIVVVETVQVEENEKKNGVDQKPAEEGNKISNGFEKSVDMSGFSPDHIVISASEDGVVTIVGKQKEELEDGGISSREVIRKVKIDPNVYDVDNVESNLSKDGNLTITAPAKDVKEVQRGSVNIPIRVQA